MAKESIVSEKKAITVGGKYTTGRRKEAVARLWLKAGGSGKIFVNDRSAEDYFPRATLRTVINQPFSVTDTIDRYDIYCTVKGGGMSGQAGAIRLAISKGLSLLAPDVRPLLRTNGFLTRDSRVVERKKYGLKKARKSFQFSKR